MRLYSYCKSSASYRVRIALALKGIRYEYTAIDISRGVDAQAEQSYGQVNAMRQVPVLEWRDAEQRSIRLTQSVAIIEYLDERYPEPPLLPRDPLARARQREAVELINAGIQPLQNTRPLTVLNVGPELEARFRDSAIARGLDALEQLALRDDGPFFVGAAPSLADVFIIPQLYSARRFGVELDSRPRLCALEQHALTHPAFRAAHPDRQPDAPRVEAGQKGSTP